MRRAAALLAASLALAACGEDEPAAPVAATEGPGAEHIHGLGINPADGSLMVATHYGLFRARPGEQRARRVGESYQDTMGFTVVGPDRFLGSGHPDAQDRSSPPLLGLIRSDDAGRSWERVSLLGEADFHVLRASGRRVYGFDASNARLLVSADGGRGWDERPPPEPLVDLALDPRDPDHVVASGQRGLYESRDAGRGWRPLTEGTVGLLAWTPGGLVLVDGRGEAHRSADGGANWQRVGEIGGPPAALIAHRGDLYAALHTNEVKRSADRGATWTTRLAALES
jgi:hypothetical protein